MSSLNNNSLYGTINDYSDIIDSYNKNFITKEEYIKQLEERSNILIAKRKYPKSYEDILIL